MKLNGFIDLNLRLILYKADTSFSGGRGETDPGTRFLY